MDLVACFQVATLAWLLPQQEINSSCLLGSKPEEALPRITFQSFFFLASSFLIWGFFSSYPLNSISIPFIFFTFLTFLPCLDKEEERNQIKSAEQQQFTQHKKRTDQNSKTQLFEEEGVGKEGDSSKKLN